MDKIGELIKSTNDGQTGQTRQNRQNTYIKGIERLK